MVLSEDEKMALLRLARATLEKTFSDNTEKPLEDFQKENSLSPALLSPSACFVTLTTRKDVLRGCIGCTTSDQPLFENVCEYTQHAALRDPRFEPIKEIEIPGLVIHISVLGPLIPLPTLESVHIGRHGISVRNSSRRGLLLASVATKYRWSREEFLKQTCLKAGLDPSRSSEYKISYFEEISFSEG